MKYGTLGTSGIEVSKLCLGCMTFGKRGTMHDWTLDPRETDAIIARALELGINFFDTANCYSQGTSEEYLRDALKAHTSREKVVIATKVYYNEGGLSRAAIMREIDGSLKRLGTDYVDLYIIHRFDQTVPMDETMSTLDSLVRSGKVRALGASAMYGYQFHNLQDVAEKGGWTKFVSMQNHYNLLYREDERELIPICEQMQVARTPYSPLAAGRLCRPTWHTDTLRSQTDKVAVAKYDSTEENDVKIVARVAELAERYNASMTQIALAWHWKKGVLAPIIGVSKLKYLDDAVGALDVELTDADVEYLDELYLPHKIMGALPPKSN